MRVVEKGNTTFTEELITIRNILIGIAILGIVLRCIVILVHARNEEQPITSALEQCKKVIIAGIILVFIPEYIEILQSFMPEDAERIGGLGSSPVINGLKILISVIIDLVVSFSATLTVWGVMKEGYAWQTAPDEQKALHIAKIRKVLLTGVLIVSASAFISLIFDYFT